MVNISVSPSVPSGFGAKIASAQGCLCSGSAKAPLMLNSASKEIITFFLLLLISPEFLSKGNAPKLPKSVIDFSIGEFSQKAKNNNENMIYTEK